MVLTLGPLHWISVGPFFFQAERLLHYLVYFLIGVGVGASVLNRGLLARDGKLAERWSLWLLAGLLAFGLAVLVTILARSSPGALPMRRIASSVTFVLSCATSCFAFLAVFIRFATRSNKVFDSLRGNAYGIYLFHFPFAIWLQYALLRVPLSGFEKGVTVLLGTLALSWCATALLRRIPAIARVI